MSPVEASSGHEYEPLPTGDSDAPLMGGDEQQMLKPEGRSGDAAARLFALVSPFFVHSQGRCLAALQASILVSIRCTP